jgi:hypothetical protein
MVISTVIKPLYEAQVLNRKNGQHRWFSIRTALVILGREETEESWRKLESYLQHWVRGEVLEKRGCGDLKFYRFVKRPCERKKFD